MLRRKAFVKKTRRGQVAQVVREHYLRDDLPLPFPAAGGAGGAGGAAAGAGAAAAGGGLGAGAGRWAVLDSNVALHQMDLLEAEGVADAVVLQTVLSEARARSMAAHDRLRALTRVPEKRFVVFSNEHHKATFAGEARPGESPNDRNDRAVRRAAAFLAEKARAGGFAPQVVLVTDDAECRRKAGEEGLQALTTLEWAQGLVPHLTDLVAGGGAGTEGAGGAGGPGAGRGGKRSRREARFPEHLGLPELQRGIKAGRLLQGPLRVSRFNCFEGFVGGVDTPLVRIQGRDRLNRATSGDVVVVEVLPRAEWEAGEAEALPSSAGEGGDLRGGECTAITRGMEEGAEGLDASALAALGSDSAGPAPCGKVVGILKRAWRQRGYAASIFSGDLDKAARVPVGQSVGILVTPVDRSIPLVRVRTRQASRLRDQRFVVVLDAWPATELHPEGHFVRALGSLGEKGTETDALLLEHDVNAAEFSADVLKCVPPLPWDVSADDLAGAGGRVDLRDLTICSVDPPGCTDIDDALHARMLDSGNLEVGVHIADVATFVSEGSAMDLEAQARGTSVYLVARRIDMLPKALTETICSLREGVNRLAFSVVWEMNPKTYEILDVRFHRSVIRSSAALTYAEAQARIDDQGCNDSVTRSLRMLMGLSKHLRARRTQAGALTLASPEVRFEVDTETHDPTNVGVYQIRETNHMVEELMLLANIAAATKTLEAFPGSAMLRRHPTPEPRMFGPLIKAASAQGFPMNPETSKTLSDSLDQCTKPDDAYLNTAIRIIATRCMTQAQYISSSECGQAEFNHYGLAAPLYTHFTSPIRRYADVEVHRLLAAAVGIGPMPKFASDAKALEEIAHGINYRHRNAQFAGRASVELHTLIFFRDKSVTAGARIMSVKSNGLVVLVPKYGIEGPVLLAGDGEDGAAGKWSVEADGQELTNGKVSYRVLDSVQVTVGVEKTAGGRERLSLSIVAEQPN